MSRQITLTITKVVEFSDCSDIWQLNEDQLQDTLLNEWEDWDSVETTIEVLNKGGKMYKVKQLYVLWQSDDGDKKLIPKDEYHLFQSTLEDLEHEMNIYRNHGSEMSIEKAEGVQQRIWNLIDSYGTLEGEEVFVVLPNDLIEGDNV